MEIWKDIPGYEGIYQASTDGNIRSVEGKQTHSTRHGVRTWKSRILKPKSDGNQRKTGYRITLWKNKVAHDYLVARLICATYHGNMLDTDMTVNHKDGDRLNNCVENLEWLTRGDNIRHAFRNGMQPDQKAITLKSDDAILIFRSLSQASEFLGHNTGYISGQIKKKRPIRDACGREYKVV